MLVSVDKGAALLDRCLELLCHIHIHIHTTVSSTLNLRPTKTLNSGPTLGLRRHAKTLHPQPEAPKLKHAQPRLGQHLPSQTHLVQAESQSILRLLNPQQHGLHIPIKSFIARRHAVTPTAPAGPPICGSIRLVNAVMVVAPVRSSPFPGRRPGPFCLTAGASSTATSPSATAAAATTTAASATAAAAAVAATTTAAVAAAAQIVLREVKSRLDVRNAL